MPQKMIHCRELSQIAKMANAFTIWLRCYQSGYFPLIENALEGKIWRNQNGLAFEDSSIPEYQ
jgi:hypothetical protein